MSETLLVQCLALVGASVLLAYVGKGINDTWLAPWPWWHKTLWLHPIVGGALLGLLPLPVPEAVGGSLASRVVLYAAAGALSPFIYERVKRKIKGEG